MFQASDSCPTFHTCVTAVSSATRCDQQKGLLITTCCHTQETPTHGGSCAPYWQADVVAATFRRAENSGKRWCWITLWLGLEILSMGSLPCKDNLWHIEANCLRPCSVCVFSDSSVCMKTEKQGGKKAIWSVLSLHGWSLNIWFDLSELQRNASSPCWPETPSVHIRHVCILGHGKCLDSRWSMMRRHLATRPGRWQNVLKRVWLVTSILPFWPEPTLTVRSSEFGWLRNKNTLSYTLNQWRSGVLVVLEM